MLKIGWVFVDCGTIFDSAYFVKSTLMGTYWIFPILCRYVKHVEDVDEEVWCLERQKN